MLLKTIIADEIRFLTFRKTSAAVAEHPNAYLVFGLFFTWLAGVGRYWDNPQAHLWQHLGLGSLVYVFVLALAVWLLLLPMKPRNGSYRTVLLFVTLTSPPAVLYAIPVERFMSLQAAQSANVWFLTIIATWRLALYAFFLRRVAGLNGWETLVITLLPVSLIIIALASLNLEHAVFEIMGGIREGTAADGAYVVVLLLSFLATVSALPLLICYVIAAIRARKSDRSAR